MALGCPPSSPGSTDAAPAQVGRDAGVSMAVLTWLMMTFNRRGAPRSRADSDPQAVLFDHLALEHDFR